MILIAALKDRAFICFWNRHLSSIEVDRERFAERMEDDLLIFKIGAISIYLAGEKIKMIAPVFYMASDVPVIFTVGKIKCLFILTDGQPGTRLSVGPLKRIGHLVWIIENSGLQKQSDDE